MQWYKWKSYKPAVRAENAIMRSRRIDAFARSATGEDPYSSFPPRNFVIVAPPCKAV
jgi:hypothetical protein